MNDNSHYHFEVSPPALLVAPAAPSRTKEPHQGAIAAVSREDFLSIPSLPPRRTQIHAYMHIYIYLCIYTHVHILLFAVLAGGRRRAGGPHIYLYIYIYTHIYIYIVYIYSIHTLVLYSAVGLFTTLHGGIVHTCDATLLGQAVGNLE